MLQGKAHAKINLFLEVLRKTPDGYHDIRTIMTDLDLCDDLDIVVGETTRSGAAACTMTLEMEGDEAHGVVAGDGNLVVKAARALMERCQARDGLCNARMPGTLKFVLHKRIHSEAGLGGGSSDAALTLHLLNGLPGFGLAPADLLEVGAHIGSDVPYFLLQSGTALAEGRGERLTSLQAPPHLWVVLVLPRLRISTAWCYNRWDELCENRGRREEQEHLDGMLRALQQGDIEGVGSHLFNHLQEPVFDAWPEVAGLPDRLRAAGCTGAAMTGSGSCFFGLAASREQAEATAQVVQMEEYGRVWITRFRSSSRPERVTEGRGLKS